MTRNPFAVARNAVSNASSRPIDDDEIRAALASGDGAGNVVRALFSDCTADTLLSMAHEAGLAPEQLKAAYATAKVKHAAANDTMDTIVKGALV